MRLTAHPPLIAADAHSSSTISAEVRDPNGNPVPDGTVVEFATSLGIIEPRARTAAGVARVRLESGTSVGTANISGIAPEGGAVAEARVDFLEPGTEPYGDAFISFSSDKYLVFEVARQIVDAAGGVRIEHRGLVIEAEEAQFELRSSTLRAKGKSGTPISLKRGGKTLAASALVYDIVSMRGALLGPAEEGAARMTFRGADLLTVRVQDFEKPFAFDYDPISESELLVKANSILIRPGEDIRFKRATYFMDGDRVMSVPLQIMPLRAGATGVGRMLTYGTDGVRLDLPIYYSLTPNTAGSVRVKRGEPTGWGNYSERRGWQVDLDNDYNYGGTTLGTFTVNRITSKDWGLRWNHRVLYDNNAQMYSYFDFPSHRDLFGSVDFSRPMRNYTWSMNFRGSKYRDSAGGYFGGTYLQSHVKPLIGQAVSYSFSSRLGYDNRQVGGRRLGTGLGLQLYGKPVRFDRQTTLSTSLSASREWGGGAPGLSLYANAGVSRMLGMKGYMGVNYSYSSTDGDYGYNSQRLSTNVNFRPSPKWNTDLFYTYGINDGTVSAFGNVAYQLAPLWRLGVINTYQKFQFGKYTDMEYVLAREVGRQEVMLTYSMSRKKLRLEMNAFGF